MTWFWVERSTLGLGLSAIRRGFELYECLLVYSVFRLDVNLDVSSFK